MNINRVNGPASPEGDRNRVSPKTQREQTQRVEKVREVDPDEQAKQRRRDKFRMMIEKTEEEVSPGPRVPSPFETQFYTLPDKESGLTEENPLPTPSSSPPPNLAAPVEEEEPEPGLPKSRDFWQDVDLPDEPPPDHPQLKEEIVPKSADKSGKKEEPPSPNKKAKETTPSGKYWDSEKKNVEPSAKEAGPVPKTASSKQAKKHPAEEELMKGLQPPVEKLDEREERGRRKKEDEPLPIVLPSAQPLPSAVQPVAMAAATFASPYLSPEVLPLFFQMVGSILIMTTPPGISRTQIVLNAPGFANSKFYGATIEIVKYSTAPDSLNIRLSGSNEAVTAFNQNLPNLMSAFQNGNFNFRIGRLEAVYSADRPVFRRKDEQKKGESGSDFNEKRR